MWNISKNKTSKSSKLSMNIHWRSRTRRTSLMQKTRLSRNYPRQQFSRIRKFSKCRVLSTVAPPFSYVFSSFAQCSYWSMLLWCKREDYPKMLTAWSGTSTPSFTSCSKLHPRGGWVPKSGDTTKLSKSGRMMRVKPSSNYLIPKLQKVTTLKTGAPSEFPMIKVIMGLTKATCRAMARLRAWDGGYRMNTTPLFRVNGEATSPMGSSKLSTQWATPRPA